MSAALSYGRTLELLDELWSRPIVPAARVKLGRATALLQHLDNPHTSFRSVHVAGSSGKGSTTTMVGTILQQAGNRTGYFRSPHLESYTERIAIDGVDISEPEWVACFEAVWPIVCRMIDGSLPGYDAGRPSFFEVLFAMATVHFRSHGVEWAAVETGMGGRLDATNTLASEVAAITNISLEHTQVLGKTVRAIAGEKAAIIKSGSHAVTAAGGDALDVIERRALDVGAPLMVIPRDVWFDVGDESVTGTELVLRSRHGLAITVDLPLGGRFQATNAATAVAVILALRERGVYISDADIIAAMESVRVPGRFEVMTGTPQVILDGAHNPAAAAAFRQSLDRMRLVKRVVLLFGALTDKNVEEMAAHLAPRADLVVLTTTPDTPRAFGAAGLEVHFKGHRTLAIDDAGLALERALAETGPDDTLVVCGSLYLVGFVRARLKATVSA